MTTTNKRLHLFEGFGIELEYMIVDAVSLDVRPIADKILQAAAGEIVSDFEDGPIAWSNELALHVIEVKTNGPTKSLAQVTGDFQKNVTHINRLASEFGAKLMPTAMHPWMDPHRELQLWPHEHNPVYEAYNRIFDCRGHGWANLQSTHLNLPFGNDDEFGRLHAAIRILLPLLPALAASSPVADGHLAGQLDYRLEVYRNNSRKIPSITGRVIPEPIFTEADYDREIFQRNYRDIAPFDPEGILQQPFLNSRGAIARFERGAIEIRVLDIQECVTADVAICEFIGRALELFVRETSVSYQSQQAVAVDPLADLFLEVIRKGERAVVEAPELFEIYGIKHPTSVAEIWHSLLERVEKSFGPMSMSTATRQTIRAILEHGPLARRIVQQLGGDSGMLPDIYLELCECLERNQMFSI
ncbi:MAG: glutamate-cysteine ligase family protein [Pirellulaceae bacterium]